MRLRKIGTFTYKGSRGLYLEAVDRPRDAARYAAVEYGHLDEREWAALERGVIVDSAVLDADPDGWLHQRLDDIH